MWLFINVRQIIINLFLGEMIINLSCQYIIIHCMEILYAKIIKCFRTKNIIYESSNNHDIIYGEVYYTKYSDYIYYIYEISYNYL